MPRGFLVKRFKKMGAGLVPPPAHQPLITSSLTPSDLFSGRVRRYSDEDRSDASSEPEVKSEDFGIPSPPLSMYEPGVQIQEEPLELISPARKSYVPSCIDSSKVSYYQPLTPTTPPRLSESVRLTKPKLELPPYVEMGPVADPAASSHMPPFKKRALSASCPPATTDNSPMNMPELERKKTPKKNRATRKLNFDEDKSSPVSGTFIRDLDSDEELAPIRRGDIDPSLNVVVVTEEARAELAKIENRIGDYVCQLCKENFIDAFGLAQHRCSRIVHVEYRCPDCEKVFNCPANLASHRRWHKPKGEQTNKQAQENQQPDTRTPSPSKVNHYPSTDVVGSKNNDEGQYFCEVCGKRFRRQAYLRKHVLQIHTLQQASTTTTAPVHHHQSVGHQSVGHQSPPMLVSVDKEPTFTGLVDNLTNAYSNDCRCAVCGMQFHNLIALEKHLRLHTNEVYACKYCSCTFFSSPGLTRHINKYHPTESRQVLLLQMPSAASVSS